MRRKLYPEYSRALCKLRECMHTEGSIPFCSVNDLSVKDVCKEGNFFWWYRIQSGALCVNVAPIPHHLSKEDSR